MTIATLSDLIVAAEQLRTDTRQTFGKLSAPQLNWQPSSEQWSVGQCFDHLVKAKEPFFQIIEQARNGTHPNSIWQRLPWWPGFIGEQMIKAMQPNSGRRVKSPKSFQPASSAIDPQVIQSFLAQQQRWIEAIKTTEAIDSANIIVTSTAAAVITYSLLDAMRLMTVHDRRHFQQAERVMQANGFPA